jgi:hypothetical protein
VASLLCPTSWGLGLMACRLLKSGSEIILGLPTSLAIALVIKETWQGSSLLAHADKGSVKGDC